MWKRIAFQSIVVVSYIGAICVLVVGGLSFQKSIHAEYCYNGDGYDVHVTNGCLVIRTLDDYCGSHTEFRFFRMFVKDTETELEFREFQKSDWYKGDNSFWERDGFTVHQRKRTCGFEFASGTYLLDYFSFADKVFPFTLIQIPCWAFLVVFSGVPFWAICSKLQSVRKRP